MGSLMIPHRSLATSAKSYPRKLLFLGRAAILHPLNEYLFLYKGALLGMFVGCNGYCVRKGYQSDGFGRQMLHTLVTKCRAR